MAEMDVILHRLGQIDKKLENIEGTTEKIQQDVNEIKACNAKQAEQIQQNKDGIERMENRQWAAVGGSTLLATLISWLTKS